MTMNDFGKEKLPMTARKIEKGPGTQYVIVVSSKTNGLTFYGDPNTNQLFHSFEAAVAHSRMDQDCVDDNWCVMPVTFSYGETDGGV